MATLIAIVAPPGAGKTVGIKYMNPEETYIINSDKKPLTFKGAKELYSKEKKNYIIESDLNIIKNLIFSISSKPEANHIKNIFIDTINSCMNDVEMIATKRLNHDQWYDYAKDIYALLTATQAGLRDDLFIFCLFHEDYNDGKRNILVNGKKMSSKGKILEGLFNNCFFIEVSKNEKNEIIRQLRVVNDGTCCAKSLEDCFETELIDLNYQFIRDKIINW